jgi:hypothetical protein
MAFMPAIRMGTAASEPRYRCVSLHRGLDLSGPPNTRMWRDDLKISANGSGLPSDRHPDRIKRAGVLGAVKVWPGKARACRKVGATANLDSSCARRPERSVGRDEETGFWSNKETGEGRKKKEVCSPL